MLNNNNIPRKIEVIHERERIFVKNDVYDHTDYQVTIKIIYCNGSSRKFESSILDFSEFVRVKSLFTEKSRFDFVISDLFQLKFFDHT